MPTTPTTLTNDDLLWLIGQKEATLLLVTRQAQALLSENERLKEEIALLRTPPPMEPNAPDHG